MFKDKNSKMLVGIGIIMSDIHFASKGIEACGDMVLETHEPKPAQRSYGPKPSPNVNPFKRRK